MYHHHSCTLPPTVLEHAAYLWCGWGTCVCDSLVENKSYPMEYIAEWYMILPIAKLIRKPHRAHRNVIRWSYNSNWLLITKKQTEGIPTNTVLGRYHTVNFPQNFHKRNPIHRSSVRARYGVSFVCWNSDLYSASVTAVMWAMSCNIGSLYNGTRLHISNRGKYICVFI